MKYFGLSEVSESASLNLETRFFNSTDSEEEMLFNMRVARKFIQKILEDPKFAKEVGTFSYQEIFEKLDLEIFIK